MSVSILGSSDHAAFYCNTEMRAFGPVYGSISEAKAFKEWLNTDPRKLHEDNSLRAIYREWYHTVWRDDDE